LRKRGGGRVGKYDIFAANFINFPAQKIRGVVFF
jgi:hypothetical protein